MPKNTIGKLNNVRTSMKASTLVIKDFDGSKRMVIGEVDLPITVGPHTFMVTCCRSRHFNPAPEVEIHN